jgi:hypothetical protein
MELIVVFLVVNAIGSLAMPVKKSRDLSVDELFEAAWEFQERLNPQQEGIDADVTQYRTSVSRVLRMTSKDALTEVEENTKEILELEKPIRAEVDELVVGSCSSSLKQLLSGITEFTGYESSNCVKTYGRGVNQEVKEAQNLISLYDGMFTELQQLVVDAFIGRNQFIQQAEIVETFENEFERRLNAWEEIKPNVEAFVESLGDKISDISNLMSTCMKQVRENVVIAYEYISTGVETCKEFDGSVNSKFKAAVLPLTLEEILPKRYFDSLISVTN